MAERNIIFNLDFKVNEGGQLETAAKRVSDLEKSFAGAKKGTLEYVEAEKQLTKANEDLNRSLGVTATNAEKASKLFDPKAPETFARAMSAARKASAELSREIIEQEKITAEFRTELQQVEAELAKIGKGNKAFFNLEAEQKKLNAAIEENVAAIRELKVDKKAADQSVSDLKEVGKELGLTEEKAKTARARLAEIRNLLMAGGLPADEIRKLKEEGGQLTDEIADTRAELAALGDDNLGSSALIQGVQGAFGAMSAFQGVVALTTDDTEAFQEQMLKAQGALSALQGVQELFISLQRESALVVQANVIRQKALNFLYDEGSGKLKKLNAALAIGTLGAIAVVVGLLAANWEKVSAAIGLTTQKQKEQQRIQQAVIDGIGRETVELKVAEKQLFETNITQEKRVEIIKDLQKRYPDLLANINAETVSNEDLKIALDGVNAALLTRLEIDARSELILEKLKERVKLEQELERITKQAVEAEKELADAQADAASRAQQSLQGVDSRTTFLTSLITTLRQEGQDVTDLIAAITRDIDAELTKVAGLELSLPGDGASGKEAEAKRAAAFKLQLAELDERERLANALLSQNEVTERKRLEVAIFYSNARLALLKSERSTTKLELQKAANDLLILQSQLANLKEKIFTETDFVGPLLGVDEGQEVGPQNFNYSALQDEAEANEVAMAEIAEKGERAILEIRLRYAKLRLDALIASGDADANAVIAANNKIIQIEAQLAKNAGDLAQERQDALIAGIETTVTATAQAADQILAIEAAKYDRLIQLQQGQVDKAKDIASQGNAELLQAEEERLDELQRKREQFVRAQQAIIATQLVAESALAIAKTAGQSGVAAPITITATLLALAAGLAQARALASQAAFFDGGYTGDGNKFEESTKLGRKPYTYHKGEYMINAATTHTGRNLEWFDWINTNKIDLDKYFNSIPTVTMDGGISDERFAELIEAVNRVPGSSVHLTERGVIRLTERGARKAIRISSKV